MFVQEASLAFNQKNNKEIKPNTREITALNARGDGFVGAPFNRLLTPWMMPN
jgi:hypothetical protein